MTIRSKHLIVLAILAPLLGLAVGLVRPVERARLKRPLAVTDWFLHWVMRNSVSSRAFTNRDVPPLNDPGLVPGAAGHYETAVPFVTVRRLNRGRFSARYVAPTADLTAVVPGWTDAELFEIVKHGVRFTGMPAWPIPVARRRGLVDCGVASQTAGYGRGGLSPASGLHGLGHAGEVSPLPITCESCHAESKLNDGSLVPRLAGQSEAYLLNALKLMPERRAQVALCRWRSVHCPLRACQNWLPTMQGGSSGSCRLLFMIPFWSRRVGYSRSRGRYADTIPACLSCHDKADANPAYPKLSVKTQPICKFSWPYFDPVGACGSQYHHLMTGFAKELTADDISAVASYFSAR